MKMLNSTGLAMYTPGSKVSGALAMLSAEMLGQMERYARIKHSGGVNEDIELRIDDTNSQIEGIVNHGKTTLTQELRVYMIMGKTHVLYTLWVYSSTWQGMRTAVILRDPLFRTYVSYSTKPSTRGGLEDCIKNAMRKVIVGEAGGVSKDVRQMTGAVYLPYWVTEEKPRLEGTTRYKKEPLYDLINEAYWGGAIRESLVGALNYRGEYAPSEIKGQVKTDGGRHANFNVKGTTGSQSEIDLNLFDWSNSVRCSLTYWWNGVPRKKVEWTEVGYANNYMYTASFVRSVELLIVHLIYDV